MRNANMFYGKRIWGKRDMKNKQMYNGEFHFEQQELVCLIAVALNSNLDEKEDIPEQAERQKLLTKIQMENIPNG